MKCIEVQDSTRFEQEKLKKRMNAKNRPKWNSTESHLITKTYDPPSKSKEYMYEIIFYEIYSCKFDNLNHLLKHVDCDKLKKRALQEFL
jgi:hypothetical protein